MSKGIKYAISYSFSILCIFISGFRDWRKRIIFFDQVLLSSGNQVSSNLITSILQLQLRFSVQVYSVLLINLCNLTESVRGVWLLLYERKCYQYDCPDPSNKYLNFIFRSNSSNDPKVCSLSRKLSGKVPLWFKILKICAKKTF